MTSSSEVEEYEAETTSSVRGPASPTHHTSGD